MSKKERLAKNIAAQQAIVNGAKSAGREMTAEEQAQFDALQRDIDNLTREIEAEEAQDAERSEAAQPVPDPEGIAQRSI